MLYPLSPLVSSPLVENLSPARAILPSLPVPLHEHNLPRNVVSRVLTLVPSSDWRMTTTLRPAKRPLQNEEANGKDSSAPWSRQSKGGSKVCRRTRERGRPFRACRSWAWSKFEVVQRDEASKERALARPVDHSIERSERVRTLPLTQRKTRTKAEG